MRSSRGSDAVSESLTLREFAARVTAPLAGRDASAFASPATGDTIAVVAADSEGRSVSLIQSLFDEFGSLDAYLWSFVGGRAVVNRWESLRQVPASTPQSDAMSKDLKKRGFRFVGTTICYAFMQATGMVNDHTIDCFRWKQLGGR